MESRDYTVSYKYKNGIPDAMVIEGASTPTQAQVTFILYTTGLGFMCDIKVRDTTANDIRYTHRPALKQIGD